MQACEFIDPTSYYLRKGAIYSPNLEIMKDLGYEDVNGRQQHHVNCGRSVFTQSARLSIIDSGCLRHVV